MPKSMLILLLLLTVTSIDLFTPSTSQTKPLYELHTLATAGRQFLRTHTLRSYWVYPSTIHHSGHGRHGQPKSSSFEATEASSEGIHQQITSLSNQQINHRIWIKRVNDGDSVTLQFWFRHSGVLKFIQDGKELRRVRFEDDQTRTFSFQEWHRFPMVRFCDQDGDLSMNFLSNETFDQFECAGSEIKITI